jgi:hypothetical protein
LAVKNDPATPPTDASAIQSTTPSQMFSWSGMGVQLSWQSERTGIENNWYALTGRVVSVKVEADGDVHIALADATGDNVGTVSAEISGWRKVIEAFHRDARFDNSPFTRDKLDEAQASMRKARLSLLQAIGEEYKKVK